MQRFGTTRFILTRQPRPGDREQRFRIPQDRTMQRPRKEAASHV